jgi:hypothetical protein
MPVRIGCIALPELLAEQSGSIAAVVVTEDAIGGVSGVSRLEKRWRAVIHVALHCCWRAARAQ